MDMTEDTGKLMHTVSKNFRTTVTVYLINIFERGVLESNPHINIVL